MIYNLIKVMDIEKEKDNHILCKIKKISEIFEIECDTREGRKKFYSFTGTKEISVGPRWLEYKTSEPTLKTFTEDDFKNEIARKLGVKKEDIKFI